MQPLSVEEVLRLHREAQQRRPNEQDAALRRLKAEHVKKRGDEAFKQGNYREAWERYSEALELQPDKAALPALHSNRSAACYKAGRHAEALADADEAARLAPGWHKAHWRRGAALLALKRVPEAVLAYREAWQLAAGGSGKGGGKGGSAAAAPGAAADAADCEARLWDVVQRLTREQLGRGLLAILAEAQAAGRLEAPAEEEASEQEQAESFFRIIKQAHQGERRPGPYYRRYLRWLQQGVQPGEAYLERAGVHTGAKCYLQGRADAQAAVAMLRAALQEERQQQPQGQGEAGGGAARKQAAQPPAGHAQQHVAAPSEPSGLRSQLALAYQRLGQAFMAEKKHADRDPRRAAKAFLRSQEVDSELPGVQDELQEVIGEMTLEETRQIEAELHNEGPADGAGASSCDAGSGGWAPGKRMFRLVLQLAFPSARAADCSSRAREMLRGSIATTAGVSQQAVTIERVMAPTAARPHLGLLIHVKVGSDLLGASRLAKAVFGQGEEQQEAQQAQPAQQAQQADQGQQADQEQQTGEAASLQPGQQGDSQAGQQLPAPAGPATPPQAETPQSAAQRSAQQAQQGGHSQAALEQRQGQLAALLGGEELVSLLGQPDAALCSAEVEDVTPACAASEAERAEQEAINRGEKEIAPEQDRRLAVPARPKMELELPYRMYRLVRADGSAVERVDKHPFCMSRVYYDATEKPEEVWTELADGSCRWRQTGGEVKVLALRVPRDLPSRQLAVDIQPYSIKAWNRASGEVYLEGELERGVVPEDCFWTHCGGEGEDGCALYLRKMNLEVLQSHWQHSEMWWPRLFKAHANIAWDDYEKDYSDLPEEVLQRHRVTEAIRDDEQRVEQNEKKHRDMLQERDDLRKRTRQERLNELRTGTKQSWVLLDRALPAA
ncbi:hypothetical protein ABPG75_004152 [Micractinium tetrahymenae]